MRVLVLGATGMLGHRATWELSQAHEVAATVRGQLDAWRRLRFFEQATLVGGVEAERFDSVVAAVADAAPQVVLNAIGIVKQSPAAQDPLLAVAVNALFPHRLHTLCRAAGARLIHLSTDCVFSGRAGPYSEAHNPDPIDLYGRSKLLGETAGAGALTLRTSMIGWELGAGAGLVEWFVRQRGGRARGFTGALFTGLTTAELARVIRNLIEQHPNIDGVHHLSAEPISKFDLLDQINTGLGLGVALEHDTQFHCDRRLDSQAFRGLTGYRPPTWESMIRELCDDRPQYLPS